MIAGGVQPNLTNLTKIIYLVRLSCRHLLQFGGSNKKIPGRGIFMPIYACGGTATSSLGMTIPIGSVSLSSTQRSGILSLAELLVLITWEKKRD